MFKEMIVSMLIAIASLGTAAAFAAPADKDVRGRMLTARSNPGDAARSSVFGSPSLRVR